MLPNTTSHRFTALDVFRGLTICFMIIVNTPGSYVTTFYPLLHAQWNGFTPTDLVFPSFLFAVGNALSFVTPKWQKLSKKLVLLKIFKRTIIIFLLGLLLNWFPFVKYNHEGGLFFFPFSDLRIFGVLQRIALCYGFTALLIYYFKPKTVALIGISFLLVYWIILYAFAHSGNPLSITDNVGSAIDRWLVGEKHLYHGEGIAFDPEGLLSTLPSIVNVIAGFIAGIFIQKKGNTYELLAKLLLAGFIFVFVAYCLNFYFPINKKLWTSSFSVLTIGLDCILLASLIYVIDFLNIKKWGYFFEVFGRNPLFIYLLSELGVIILYFLSTKSGVSYYQWIYVNIFSDAGGNIGSLLFALSFMLFCWVIGLWLEKKKIYIRV